MFTGEIVTAVFGALAFWWGIQLGKILLRKGAIANDLFKGKDLFSLIFLGLYVGMVILAFHLPQAQALPLKWRFYGMEVTWGIMRVILLGFCGVTLMVSWQTARSQIIPILLLGLIGFSCFTVTKAYLLAPIYPTLGHHLQPNGVFKQTSDSSCAPAALATVLRQWGIDATEASVAQQANTSRLGTSMPQLIVAARLFGMEGQELSPTWEQMQQINRTGVLSTWLISRGRRAAHAVALLALHSDYATLADPAFGRIYQVPRSRFNRIWRKEYVPIFRPEELEVSIAQATEYLQKLGYNITAPEEFLPALKRFQHDINIKETGKLDPKTILLLTGPFLQGVPTLLGQ
jgi:predicted double-glycine peptidase/putative effector of murein hydrolase LrgA (UPF0299 family)